VAGLLGLTEILKELRGLREDFNNYVKTNDKRWRSYVVTFRNETKGDRKPA
jgi:hypothetical protein